MRLNLVGVLTSIVLILAGCTDDKSTSVLNNINEAGFLAKFSPGDSVIPFPNNVLFQGKEDGTINIPVAEDASDGQKATIAAMNDHDGFSTVAPISTTFSGAIDVTSLVPGSTVRVFEVTLRGTAGAVSAINRELTGLAADFSNVATAEYNVSLSSLDSTNSTLVISPLKPLKQSTSYLVALSNGIRSTSGDNAAADFIYGFTKASESLLSVKPPTSLAHIKFPALQSVSDENDDSVVDGADVAIHLATIDGLDNLRLVTDSAEKGVEAFTITNDSAASIADLAKRNIILSWSFTTQTIGAVLTQIRADLAVAGTLPASSFDAGPVDISPLGLTGVGSVADFYKGSLSVPYYLNASDPFTGYWEVATGNKTPDLKSTQNIPILVSVPKTAKPEGGWPTVIFQHGITRDRSLLFGVADYLAAAGYAAVSIDLPLHGIVKENEYDVLGVVSATERTFDLDVLEQDTNGNIISRGQDGTSDSSGIHFINLTSLRTSRDNTRQGTADLFALRFALDSMDYDNTANGPDFNTSNLMFLGHSLGAVTGAVFVALEEGINTAILAMPGGGIAKLLDGSATFGATIAAGLAANGIIKGTADFESFMASAQLVLDSGDPINYASTLAASGKGLLVLEVIGDGTGTGSHLPDLVIPNKVPDDVDGSGTIPAPLSGTGPFATLLGAQKISETLVGDGDSAIKAWVRFVKGHHGSLVTPNNSSSTADEISAAVYAEMRSEITSFLATSGTQVTVDADDSIDMIEDQ